MPDRETNVLCGKHIALVSTVPYFMVSQLTTQIQYLLARGMCVTLITSPGEALAELPAHEALNVITMDIPRKQAPWRDLKALIRLSLIFRRGNFCIVHSTTPKAGLLCAIAGKLAGIPVRLHTFTGQAWVTRKGLMRWVMRFADKVIVQLMTHCYADSPSQRDFLVEEGFAQAGAISVIGHGSLAGVDMQRFSPSMKRHADELRQELKLEAGAFVIIYIGRITRDKGLYECLDAFAQLQAAHPQAILLLLGPVDDGSGVDILHKARDMPGVNCLGYQAEPERFLAISDVLCLPSYREGFGTVVIEAAAMAVPCVGTCIAGLVDAIEDGVSGLLVPARDSEALHDALEVLLLQSDLRIQLGKQAYERCRQFFASEQISKKLVQEYARYLTAGAGL